MRSRVLTVFYIMAFVLVSLINFSCAKKELPQKDKIVFGGARPMSGVFSGFEDSAFGPIYKMWAKEVNKKGGIYVKEYGKKLPIELKIYDDKSDMGTMTRLLEKLIVEDKVDFILPPCSTAFLFAGAAIAKKYNKILIGGEGGASSMEKQLPNMPNVFMTLQYSNRYQMPALAEVFKDVGVENVAIFFIEDLHGIEYQSQATAEFAKVGINVVMIKGVPFEMKDVSALLKQAKAANVDAVCAFTYPPVTFNMIGQAKELGINFKAMLLGPGGEFGPLPGMFGNETIEGVMFEGAFSRKSTEKINEFVDLFMSYYKPDQFGWWGGANYYAGLQCLEQAIEKAGTLDQTKIMEVMGEEKFDTVLGKTWFENQLLAKECHPGQIGQWQNGAAEVISPRAKRTAEPIYPKPDWPTK
ncbi:MAG: amino acid ABC transporter substrate-binding protein [Spirochaetes bacterium]|nr:amino acid ABC transporter substrate-binding protein [Spirochaetota bacterium]